MDRLITELAMTPVAAYHHITTILEQVNVLMSSMHRQQVMDEVLARQEALSAQEKEEEESSGGELMYIEEAQEDEHIMFSPAKGNVVFASAVDGWAFGVKEFAHILAKQLGMSKKVLKQCLWGEFYYHAKTKTIKRDAGPKGNLKPMFVEFVLRNIWSVYKTVRKEGLSIEESRAAIGNVLKTLELVVPAKELTNRDKSSVLQSIMSRWLPLSASVLDMVVAELPSPKVAQQYRMDILWPDGKAAAEADPEGETAKLWHAACACDHSPGAPTLAFIAKMMAQDTGRPGYAAQEEGSDYVGLCRVFCGRLEAGAKVSVMHSRRSKVEARSTYVQGVHTLMGRELTPCEVAPAGSVCGVGGFGACVLKTATLCSEACIVPINHLEMQVAPIVRVALETKDPADMQALVAGLTKLNHLDPGDDSTYVRIW